MLYLNKALFFTLLYSCILFSFSSAEVDRSIADPLMYVYDRVINHQLEDGDINYLMGLLNDDTAETLFSHISAGRIEDLLHYVAFLNSRISFLQRNNDLLISFIHSKAALLGNKGDQFNQLLARQKKVFASLEKLMADRGPRGGAVDEFYTKVKELEGVLAGQLETLQFINDGLRSIKIGILAEARKVSRDDVLGGYRQQLDEMKQMVEKKEQVIMRQDKNFEELQNEFAEVKLGLAVFRERLQDTNQKVDDMVEEIAACSLDLFQKERQNADVQGHTQALANELQETQERLRLVQRIIQEKDDHIQSLETEVLQIQAGMTADDQGIEVAALRDDMNAMVEELRQTISQDQAKIKRLESRFQEVVLANAQLESELVKTHLLASLLERQVEQKDGMIADLERNFTSHIKKMGEMKDIVKIYQMKLNDYQGMLEQKELELQTYRQRSRRHEKQGRVNMSLPADDVDNQSLPIDISYVDHWSLDEMKGYSSRLLEAIYSIRE